MFQFLRVSRPIAGLLLAVCCVASLAQSPEPRLGRVINQTAREVLRGSRAPGMRSAQDLGPVSADAVVHGITLVFRRSGAQETALEELLAAQQDPASPLYHQWLSTEAFASRYGVADQDIVATEHWLAAQGLQIEGVTGSRDRITFSGTAGQVRSAFGAELRRYWIDGEEHFAPGSDLTLPAELASVTGAVLHLSDFRPKPSWKALSQTKANYTTLSTQAHTLDPKDIFTMYDLNPLLSQGILGAGQALAVVGQSYANPSTSGVGTFQARLGQYTPISMILVPDSGVQAVSPGDEGETEIDLEYSAGIAQNANIYLVYVGANQNYNVFDALAYAITQNIAPVVSISYSSCEPMLGASDLDQANALFEEASAQGQTLVASSGDSGSTSCAAFAGSPDVPVAEQEELAVSFPASSPYVTAVGGTQMAAGTFAAGNSTYWASASGVDNTNSLLGYVPEVVWNEGTPSVGIVAGGGGTSTHYPRPSWQSGVPGIPAGTYRLLPDIALQSSEASPGYVVCSGDPSLIRGQGQTSSCVSGLQGSNGKLTTAGGTSFAAPIFAGFVAILNQVEHSTGQGNLNPTLYRLASNAGTFASAFHDIVSGNNACVSGATDCTTAGASGYTATAGYDEATGLGSLDFNALATVWPAGPTASLLGSTIMIAPGGTTAAPGQTLPVQIYVSGFISSSVQRPVPTGGVSISVDGNLMVPSLAFTANNPQNEQSSAPYHFAVPATSGSHLMVVKYPGDANYAPSATTYSVLTGNVLATGSVSLSVGNLTIANGSTGKSQVTITPSNGYAGRLVWGLAVASTSTTSLSGCFGIPSVVVSGTSTATLTLGVGSACSSAASASREGLGMISDRRSGWGPSEKGTIFTAALLCGGLIGLRRRRFISLVVVILLVPMMGIGLTGCGGGSGSNSGNGTTTSPASSVTTYNMTLTGTDSVNSSIKATTTFTLTVD